MDEIRTEDARSAASSTASTASSTDFAEGDLGRIQGILLGDHARRVDDRLASLEQALLGAIADLRSEMEASISDLRRSVTAEGSNRLKAIKNLSDRVETEVDLRSEGEAALIHKIDSAESSVRELIAAERASTVAGFDAEMAALRDRSVNRKNLAALLSSTAEQLLDE